MAHLRWPALSSLSVPVVLFNLFCCTAVHAFPTSDNVAKLAGRWDISPPSTTLSSDDFTALLHKLNERSSVARDASARLVDVTGDHAFQAPDFEAGDQRGPCPGLNALANHGYIPRDGTTSLVESIFAASTVLGMGADLAGLLSILGTIEVGNPLSLNPGFSIGGKSSDVSNLLGNLLGLLNTPGGLDASHNIIETDSSGTRNDLYVTGDAWNMDLDLFKEMLDGSDGDVVTLDDGFDFAMKRFRESIATNPDFFYGPATGMLVRNGGFILPKRIMSNFSDEHPLDGQLTKDNLKSFYGVVEQDGEMVYNKGCEQIPANFYRRPVDYNLVNFNLDIAALVLKYPELASIGGNTGEVNSFAGVDVEDVTGGVINALSLTEDNNIVCFVLEVVKGFVPQTLDGLFSVLTAPLALLETAVAPLVDLGCPALGDLSLNGENLFDALMKKYPGAGRSEAAF